MHMTRHITNSEFIIREWTDCRVFRGCEAEKVFYRRILRNNPSNLSQRFLGMTNDAR
jgi:hypothetical protein